MLYYTGSWSAGIFIPEILDKNVVLKHWILISRRHFRKTKTEPACCFITLDPNRRATLYHKKSFGMMLCNTGSWSQVTLYQKNQPGMMLYNTGSWSAGVFIREERISILFYNTGSWSAGDFVPLEACQHAVIRHWILNCSLLYAWRSVSACCYMTLDLEQHPTLYKKCLAACYYITLYPNKQAT